MRTVMFCCLMLTLAINGCAEGERQRATDTGANDRDTSPDTPDEAVSPLCATPPAMQVAGGAEKVCQLTGEEDRQTGELTTNRTFSRFGLEATDLGSSFEYDGQMWVLFGDSFPTGGTAPNPSCGDAVAYTTDVDAADCVSLDFVTRSLGVFRSPEVPGVDLGCFDVPLDGVGSGDSMYVWFSTDCMRKSILARSDDGAESFTFVHALSDCGCEANCEGGPAFTDCDLTNCHFINVSADVVPGGAFPHLPEGSGSRVLLFGTGRYRNSDVYLATVPLAQIEDRQAYRFFAGMDAEDCAPSWSADEADAAPVFESSWPPTMSIGEISAHYSEVLEQFAVVYQAGNGVHMRTALQPWGPFDDEVTLFDPVRDDAYCAFIYDPAGDCPDLSDPGRLTEIGGHYGPYIMERYTEGGPDHATLYFVMSTWNPYNVVLMRTTVERAGDGG